MVYNKLRTEVTQHVFATFTYRREDDLVKCWKSVTKDFNRFITNYRRLHRDGCEYIRTVETHRDNYPHIHAVLQLKSGILITDGRYFARDLYQKWKSIWQRGLSDFQAPRDCSIHSVLYIVKYISKDSTLKTLWRKYYTGHSRLNTSAPNVALPTDTTWKPQTAAPQINEVNPSTFFCKQFKIKQCSWSRGFVFPQKPLPKSLLVGQSLLTPSNK